MFTLSDHAIGDVWPFTDASGVIHLYFLVAPLSDPERRWSIGHLAGRHPEGPWQYHGVVLAPGPAGAFDDRGLATGSVIAHGGRYFMAYTGHGCRDQIKSGSVGMAVSDDLFVWQKLPDFKPIVINSDYYESKITGSRPFLHWRDPFLLADNGQFHLFLCARRRDGELKTRGTVAHLTSGDLRHWEMHPALAVEPFCEEMECPQIYKINGRYLLLFCTHTELIDPALFDGGVTPPGGGFGMTSDALTGPYRRVGTGKISTDVPDGYFYAPQLLWFEGQPWLIGTLIDADKTSILAQAAPQIAAVSAGATPTGSC